MVYQIENDGKSFLLDELTLDQLRKLCKQVGIRYVNSSNKVQCRKALAMLVNYVKDKDATTTLSLDKSTENIVRITNIIFGHDFVDSFLKLNDIKNRQDHESSNLPKAFWESVGEAMNCSDDDDADGLIEKIVLPDNDEHAEDFESLNLSEFDIMTPDAIRKKVHLLFKVRAKAKENMTKSGTHDSDPFNFMEVAVNKVGKVGLSMLGAYYFYQRCEEHPGIDDCFDTSMSINLLGNTTNLDGGRDDYPNVTEKSQRKRAYAAMTDLTNIAANIKSQMEQSNKLVRKSQLISVAQTLGKHDILEKILQRFVDEEDEDSTV